MIQMLFIGIDSDSDCTFNSEMSNPIQGVVSTPSTSYDEDPRVWNIESTQLVIK